MHHRLPFDLVATRSEIEDLRSVENDLTLLMTELTTEKAQNKELESRVSEYRDLEINLKNNIEILQTKVSQLLTENSDLTSQNITIPTLVAEVTLKDKEMNDLIAKVSKLELELQAAKTNATVAEQQHTREIFNFEQEHSLLQKTLSDNRQQLSEYHQSTSSNTAQREAAQTELSNQSKKYHHLEQRFNELQKEASCKQNDHITLADAQQQAISELKNSLMQCEASADEKQSEIRKLQNNLLNQVNECRELMYKLQQKEAELEDKDIFIQNQTVETEKVLVSKITALARDNERLTKQSAASQNLLPKISQLETRLQELSSSKSSQGTLHDDNQKALIDYIADLEQNLEISRQNEAAQADKSHQIATKISDLESKFSRVGLDPSKFSDLKIELAAAHKREIDLKDELLKERQRAMAVAMSPINNLGSEKELVAEIEELSLRLSQSHMREGELKEQLIIERQRLLSVTSSVVGNVASRQSENRQPHRRRQVISPGRPKRKPVMSPPLSPDLHSCTSSPPMSPLRIGKLMQGFEIRRDLSPFRDLYS